MQWLRGLRQVVSQRGGSVIVVKLAVFPREEVEAMPQIVRMKIINCTFSGMLGNRDAEIGLCCADTMDEQSRFYARHRWHAICTPVVFANAVWILSKEVSI